MILYVTNGHPKRKLQENDTIQSLLALNECWKYMLECLDFFRLRLLSVNINCMNSIINILIGNSRPGLFLAKLELFICNSVKNAAII